MMKNRKLVIIGCGDFAELMHYYFSTYSDYDVVAFSVNKKFIAFDKLRGLPVVELEEIEELYSPYFYDIYVAIGYRNLNQDRENIYMELKKKGYKGASFIHPTSIIDKNSVIGEHCVIMENCIVQPNTYIGLNSIVWCGAIIAHDVKIEKSSFLAPGVSISGFSKIGSYCFLGNRCIIIDNISIGDKIIIGAGALVTKDVYSGSLVKGIKGEKFDINDISEKGKSNFL